MTSHLWSVTGVINNGHATLVSCTNAAAASITVGVEVFDPAGASLSNPATTSVVMAPGATVLFGTQAAVGYVVDSALNVGIVQKGSARVLATAPQGIVCTSWLVNPGIGSADTALKVFKKSKQKGD